jgi:glycosyltransferase involved in cell wall biosynthesis
MRDASSGAAPKATVAYVLKSFPRLSETFIASEIYRLERLGVDLRLFVIKRPSEPIVHPIADAIAAPRSYLPEAAPISDVSTRRWLREHAPRFAAALGRQSVRSPLRMLRAAAVAFGHAVRARKGRWALPRRSMLKEFLQAAALADAVTAAGDVRHLHAHFCHSATTVAWLAAMMSGLPLSFTAHAKDVYSPDLNPAGLLTRKLAAASFVVTCTHANQVYLQAQTTTPVHCIYHGLDVEFVRLIGASDRRRSHGGRLRALAVARLVRKKGLDVFIDALAILRERGLAFDATIVGEDGDQGLALRAQAARLGLEGIVRFTGPMTQAELFAAYRQASLFCLPCRVLDNGDRDGIPNVIAEAMACGLPVVTTAVCGIPELLEDGRNGVIVPMDDAVATADAMERLHGDPALGARLADCAAASIRERFDGDRMVLALSSLLAGARP